LAHKGFLASDRGTSDNNRRAKYYTLTAAGRKRLGAKIESWNRLVAAIATALKTRPEGAL